MRRVKTYEMYDHIQPRLYCVIAVNAEGDNYQVLVSEGDVVGVVQGRHPYVLRQANSQDH